jgi:hypothetical protein
MVLAGSCTFSELLTSSNLNVSSKLEYLRCFSLFSFGIGLEYGWNSCQLLLLTACLVDIAGPVFFDLLSLKVLDDLCNRVRHYDMIKF